MKALSKFFLPLVAMLALAGCGGGSGGSSGSAFEPPQDLLTVSVAASSITTNNYTTLTVSVKKQDGTAEADGTSISASVSPATIGSISGATGNAGTSATSALSGGTTSFIFNSATNVGTAIITVSLPPIGGNPNSVTASTNIAVTQGNGIDPRLKLVATATTLPLNPYAALAETAPFPGNYLGSPYIAEVAVEWRHTNGQLVTGTSKVNVAIAPVTNAGFSTLDDPTTPWTGETTNPQTITGNEFLTILGSGPVNVTGGVGTIFVHADDVPGTATLSVTAVDPDNGETISSQLTFTIAGATSNNLPGAVSISQAAGGVYISGSNGAQSKLVSATVTDGNGALIANPSDDQGNSWDNVQFQIVGPAGTDAKLSAQNAAGSSQTGTTVVTSTHNGVANVTFQAGAQQGPVQVKATVDRGDNNVDNGIQDAVSATASVIVSDGKLYSLTLAVPGTNAILVNAVSTAATASVIPTNPNASYSLTISAIGTDRQGNPVVPGTVLNFGSLDTPQSNFAFSIAGVQGNPAEGGTSFTANDGHFISAGGGSGPGDTLIVIGKQSEGAPAGNDDLESAAKITAVYSNTSLNVATAFNLNDTTGASINNGSVLPYVIGRATIGNVSTPAATNTVGVATTTLNYPVSALGKASAVWVQGTGIDNITGGTKTITDAALVGFPGVAPAKIVISPSPIPGNIKAGVSVTVCIEDAAASPLAGVQFQFTFANLGIGSGKVDNLASSGNVPQLTDASGCVTTTVLTAGVPSSGTGTSGPSLTFAADGASATAPITVSSGPILLATPSALGGTGGSVTLTLEDSDGGPVSGVLLVGSCTGDPSISISSPPGVTGASPYPAGVTSATITANLDSSTTTPGSGSCTFTTGTGTPSATVTLSGICTVSASPSPCG